MWPAMTGIPARSALAVASAVGLMTVASVILSSTSATANSHGPSRATHKPAIRSPTAGGLTRTHHRRLRTRTIHVKAGATPKRFELSAPSGAIRLFRVTVPHGTRATLTGTIPSVAGIGISAPSPRDDSGNTCRRHGAVDVCTQAEEACPMPAATWHFRLHKLAGPAGEIRLDFLIGRYPT